MDFFSSCNLAKSDNLFLFAFFLWFFLWFFSLSHRVYVACFVDFSFSLYFYFLSRLNLVHKWIPYEINHNVEFAIKLSSHTRWLDLSRHYFQTKPVYCSVIDENFDDGKSCTNFFFRFLIANFVWLFVVFFWLFFFLSSHTLRINLLSNATPKPKCKMRKRQRKEARCLLVCVHLCWFFLYRSRQFYFYCLYVYWFKY